MSKVKIYGILNPISGKIFYVGASVCPEKRFEIHKNGGEWHPVTFKYKQIKQLKEKKVLPILIIFEEVEMREARDRESYYIDLHIPKGVVLSQPKSGYPHEQHFRYGMKRVEILN